MLFGRLNYLLDTSAVATDTIDYFATDQSGNTATSTRTVLIEAPDNSTPPAPPVRRVQQEDRASLRPFYVSRSCAQHTIEHMEKIALICLLIAAIALLAWWAKT
jgi:hypothetical protein